MIINKNKETLELEQWRLFILELKAATKKKFGKVYQKPITEKVGINKNRLSRFFNRRNPPKLDTVFIVLDALDLEIVLKKRKKK